MINKTGFRALLESEGCAGDHRKLGRRLTHLMGLTDERGRPYFKSRTGDRCLRNPPGQDRLHPDEISVRGLQEALLGDDLEKNVRQMKAAAQLRFLLEAAGGDDDTWTRGLLEDTGAGAIQASTYANTNAFTAATVGLLDVAILQAYENPLFIGDKLAPDEPSKIFEGRKTIGVSRLGDVAEERLPGMPTKRVQAGERWLTQPRTVENAVACEITQEALYLDLTGGQLAEHCGAAGVGEWLGFRKELRIIDSFIGGVNSYNYKGTNYSTYISGGYYDNYISSGNELLHEDSLQAALIKFRDMQDPDISQRILIQPNTILVNREKIRTANSVAGANAQSYELRDAPGATTGTQQINVSTPYYKGEFQLLESPLVYQEMIGTGPTQLSLSTSIAAKVWFMFESGNRTHVYVQNWPMRTQSAAPNQVDMIDRGIVLYVKADERGIPFWKEPRRVVQSRA